MNRLFMLISLAGSLASASVAGAASVDFGTSNLNGNGVIDNSSLGLLSLSVDVTNLAPIDLSIVLDGSEQGGSFGFNGDFAVDTLAPAAIPGYRIELLTPGVAFSVVGDVVDSFGGTVATSGSAIAQDLAFAPAEDLAFFVGNVPFGGPTDWTISVLALPPGVGRIDMRLTAIPEPGTALLMGLGLLGLVVGGRAPRAPRV
jgi:hypothetical protein